MPRISAAQLRVRHDEILSAATQCFARSGYRGTSMADIAAQANVSVGALYRYFPSKEALFDALLKRVAQNSGLSPQTPDNQLPAQVLRRFVRDYLSSAQHPRYREALALDLRLQAEALDSAELEKAVNAAVVARTDSVAALLASAKGCSEVDAETRAQARAFVALLRGAGHQILENREFDADYYRQSVEVALNAWIRSETPPK